MEEKQIAAQAAALLEAERSGVPTATTSSSLSFSEAYAIQDALLKLKVASGRHLRGYKVGLTSPLLQKNMGASEPIYGHLTDAMFYASGSSIPMKKLIHPRIEVELAFVLGRPLAGPDCTLTEALNAVEYVFPALELVDFRLVQTTPQDRIPGLPDVVSDNSNSAGIILGVSPFRPDSSDLRRVGAICTRNGLIEDTGLAAAVLNHPVQSLVWLANSLSRRGERLEAGHVVLAGAFTVPVAVNDGDTVYVDYGCHGSVTCHFSTSI